LLYMKIDQIMLGSMVNQTEVGIYVAATRLSEAWYFVGLTLIGVYFPKMLSIKKTQGQELYLKAIVKDGRWIMWGALTLALTTSFIAGPLIGFLYGDSYAASANVLVVSIWAVPFVYLGAVASKMFVAESKQTLVFWRSCWGLLINVLFNLWLIPLYGALGAAIATLVSQAAVGVLFNISGIVPGVLSSQCRMVFGR
ncbi:MAG: polysaccharide biosynthesis C-terminal domain-containing protein, partial [Colwellia sp.]